MYCVGDNASDDHAKRQEVQEMKLQHTHEINHAAACITVMTDFKTSIPELTATIALQWHLQARV